jgi:hypothetical protein
LIKYVVDNVKWQTKDISNSIILTGEAQHSTEACELIAHTIITENGNRKRKENMKFKIQN